MTRIFGAAAGALTRGGHHGFDSFAVVRISPGKGGLACCGMSHPPARYRYGRKRAGQAWSLPSDVRRLDDRPPSVDFRLLPGGKRRGRLLLARKKALAAFGEPRLQRRIRQRVHDGAVEPLDDGAWRTFGCPDR